MRNHHRSDPTGRTDPTDYSRWLGSADPAVVANAVICLIHQANFLPDRQVVGLEHGFIEKGGYSEQLAAARIAERDKERNQTEQSNPTDWTQKVLPACPLCGKPMAPRTARKGQRAGKQFWGIFRPP